MCSALTATFCLDWTVTRRFLPREEKGATAHYLRQRLCAWRDQ
jgi:hypothetical protein